MKKLLMKPKLVITILVVLIVILGLVAVVPVIISLFLGPGVRTEPLSAENAQPASTEINGEWSVVEGRPPNTTSVGYTFNEILPGERTRTSGSTTDVTGSVTIEEGTLTAGEVNVDLTNITSDRDVRDENVRNKLLETHDYPTAAVTITEPVDVSSVPEDGTPGTVSLAGDLEIKGTTLPFEEDFQVLRDGESVVVSGTVIIDRNAYGVESPEMIAAEIAEEGEINIRLSLAKE